MDPEAAICTVSPPAVEEEEPAEAEAEVTAEPELIGRKAEDEPEEEGEKT
jgi:hypothetical protein